MDAQAFVATLNQQGFTLRPLPGDKLEIRPAHRITAEIRDELRRRKAEVLQILTLPHVNTRGELIVPFDSNPRFHWWSGGQPIRETLRELGASPDVLARYVDERETLRVVQ